jgi:hypothetical protein
MWSYTREVKEELCRLEVGGRGEAGAELFGMWDAAGHGDRLAVGSALVLRRAYRLARAVHVNPLLHLMRKKRRLQVALTLEQPGRLADLLGRRTARAYLRGAFLARGYVAEPERAYKMEIAGLSATASQRILEALSAQEVMAHLISRRGQALVYLNGHEGLGRFLASVGAYNARLSLESLLVVREVKNRVNRLVNGESANLRRAAESGVRQQEAIRRLLTARGAGALSPAFLELARLRLRHPDWTLSELGAALNPPLGKSGVAHRLRKLVKWAGDSADSDGRRRV